MSVGLAAWSAQRAFSASALRVGSQGSAAQELASSLSEQISGRADACATFAGSLDAVARKQLLQALVASESAARGSDTPIDSLFTSYDREPPFNFLDRSEFQAAVLADRAARASREAAAASESQPQPSRLAIGFAASIPFVGMGAVDNSIMLIAGSEIDAVFGAKLGLSTLAAAGLGNMVSDIAGVSMANRIESLTRRSKWIDAAAFKAGSRTPSGRAARLTGSVVGVSVGCLLGMAPLLFMDTHEHDAGR